MLEEPGRGERPGCFIPVRGNERVRGSSENGQPGALALRTRSTNLREREMTI